MDTLVFSILFAAIFSPQTAHAASFDSTVQAVVEGIIRIFQIAAMGYLGKNAFDHVRNRPDAADKTPSTVLGIVVLIGISAVWAWLKDKVR